MKKPKILTPNSKTIKYYGRSLSKAIENIKVSTFDNEFIKNKITEESNPHESTGNNKDQKTCNSETENNYRFKKKCSHCFQETTRRLTLFLLQDDRVIDRNNPLLCETPHKAPLPFFESKSKSKFKSAFQNNSSYPSKKSIIDNIPKEIQHENIININKELINNLNNEIASFSKRNCPISNKTFQVNFFSKPKRDSSVKKNSFDILEKLRVLSPIVADKKAKNHKRIPFIFKQMKLTKNHISANNTININNSVNSKNNNDSHYEKQKINLEDILIMHNSTIRKSVSEFKVKNFQLKQSLKLKNRPIYSAFPRRRTDEEIYTSSGNGVLYI